jgi:hypothetical protein
MSGPSTARTPTRYSPAPFTRSEVRFVFPISFRSR